MATLHVIGMVKNQRNIGSPFHFLMTAHFWNVSSLMLIMVGFGLLINTHFTPHGKVKKMIKEDQSVPCDAEPHE